MKSTVEKKIVCIFYDQIHDFKTKTDNGMYINLKSA